MINCLECDAVLDVEEDELDEGDRLMCEDCGLKMVVTSVDPIEIDLDEEDEEEEDEEFDEDEEEEFDEEEEEEEEDEDGDWR